MSKVFDVAQYILEKQGEMTAMKLQKLVYYCQAWSLVWNEEPLFDEPIQAWANGPVCPNLYTWHKGKFKIDSCPLGNSSNLTQTQRDDIDYVLEFYGGQDAQWLSDLTHMETPWSVAREGLDEGTPSNAEISHASMHEYYLSLLPKTR